VRVSAQLDPRTAALAMTLACGRAVPPDLETPMNAEASAGVSDRRLARLLSDHWEWTMARWPEWATRLGDHRYDSLATDRSAAAADADLAQLAVFRERAAQIDPGLLGSADRTTLALFDWELRTGIDSGRCHLERWSVGVRDNPVVWMNELSESQPLASPEDGAHLVARYRALATSIDQNIDTLRLGLREGSVTNAESARRALAMVDDTLSQPSERWQIVVRAGDERPSFSAADRDRLIQDVRAAVDQALRPALTRYQALLREEILPVARDGDRVGIWALPGGDACYRALIERHTSLPLSPSEIAAYGTAELERIHADMRTLGARLFGTDDLRAIFARLRGDPSLYFHSPEEVETRASAALAAAQAVVPSVFGRLPQTSCEVRPIPDYEAPFTTIAYYMPAVPGEAPGYYYVNTSAPETRPRYEAAVLAYHESVPGHHLQIALAQELGELPAFRRHMGTTAFVEGWALYTERLADELGLYADDLDRMGMLSFDAWRASRLVVDTGVHAFHWTRERAVAFLRDNTPLAENNIDNEVDRYISWPGQAVAYKIGQREILDLRQQAMAQLGDRFSLAGFHDAVLDGGAVTLPVLATRIDAWSADAAVDAAH